MSTQHDGTALTRLYAQLRDEYRAETARLREERDADRAEADRLREYMDLRIADATEQHRIDAEEQYERARRSEAEAARLRGLIMEHRAAVFIATPIATANHQLWREALDRAIFDSEDGDE